MPIWSPWRHIPTQKIPKYPPGASTPDFASNCQKRFFGGFDLSKHFVIGNTPILTSVPVFSRVKFLLGVVWSLSEAQRSVLDLFCCLRYSTPFCPLKIFSRSPACPPRLVQLVVTPVLLSCPQKKSITSQLFWRKLISLKLVPDQNPRPKRSITLPPGQRRSYQ